MTTQTQISLMRTEAHAIATQIENLRASQKSAEAALTNFYNKHQPLIARYNGATFKAFNKAFPKVAEAREALETAMSDYTSCLDTAALNSDPCFGCTANAAGVRKILYSDPLSETYMLPIEEALSLLVTALNTKSASEDLAPLHQELANARANVAKARRRAFRSTKKAWAMAYKIGESHYLVDSAIEQAVETVGYNLIERRQQRRIQKRNPT